MTIASGDLKKIDVDLTKEPTLAFDQEFAVGDGSGNPPKSISSEVLLRTRVAFTQDISGDPEADLDFQNYNQYNYTIDEDVDAIISNVPTNSVNYAKFTKPSASIISFTGADHEALGSEVGLTEVHYRIDSKDGDIIVTQENCQSSGSLVIGDLSPDLARTISSFTHFDWQINNNMCDVFAEFNVFLPVAAHEVTITLANFDPTPAYTNNPINLYVTSADFDNYSSQGYMSKTSLKLEWETISGLASDTITVRLNGSFKVT